MATSIRLKRVGAKKEASYRIIVTDSREGTSGAAIERLGTYNPRTRPSMIRVNAARTLHWLGEGAEPSDTVRSLLQKTGVWKQFHDGVTGETLEEEVVFLGPPEGERGTSQRPMPTDRAPKVVEVAPAAEAPVVEVTEEPVAEAEPVAEEAAPAEAEAEAAEEPTAEAAAPVADEAEEPVAQAEAVEEPAVEEPAVEAEPVAEEAAPAEAEAEAAEEASAEAAEPVADAAEEPAAEADDAEKE